MKIKLESCSMETIFTGTLIPYHQDDGILSTSIIIDGIKIIFSLQQSDDIPKENEINTKHFKKVLRNSESNTVSFNFFNYDNDKYYNNNPISIGHINNKTLYLNYIVESLQIDKKIIIINLYQGSK